MITTLLPPLVNVDWLKENLHHPDIVILDASAHMPGVDRDAVIEWQQQHIPKSRFFDFNKQICDHSSPLPHMLPDAATFTREAQALGINNDSMVIIYDSLGIFSAPRAWWMFMAMGHTRCAVLDGGLPAWIAQDGATTSSTLESLHAIGNFKAQFNDALVKNKEQILSAMTQTDATIIDARSKARFNGEAPEPRAGLISGHIPHSKNLPFSELLTDGKFKPTNELQTLIRAKLPPEHTLYATCGSGITACVIAFAAFICGHKNIAVYDGSWSEWGQPELDLPINTTLEQK